MLRPSTPGRPTTSRLPPHLCQSCQLKGLKAFSLTQEGLHVLLRPGLHVGHWGQMFDRVHVDLPNSVEQMETSGHIHSVGLIIRGSGPTSSYLRTRTTEPKNGWSTHPSNARHTHVRWSWSTKALRLFSHSCFTQSAQNWSAARSNPTRKQASPCCPDLGWAVAVRVVRDLQLQVTKSIWKEATVFTNAVNLARVVLVFNETM